MKSSLPLFFIVCLLFIFSNCSTTYHNPSIIYRSSIQPRSKDTEVVLVNQKDRNFEKNKKLLIVMVSYDQLDNVSVSSIVPEMLTAVSEFKNNIEKIDLFKEVKLITLSHFKIGTIDELQELARRFDTEYIILLSSSYNFYKYGTSFGSFLAWIPVTNFFTPLHRYTGNLSVQATFMKQNGAILFDENSNIETSGNTSVLYSRDHFKRLSKELHERSYQNLSELVIKQLKGRL